MEIYSYDKKMGIYSLPDKLKEALLGASIEEQLEYFRVTENSTVSKTGFGSTTSPRYAERLEENYYVRGVITDNGIIVGAMVKNEFGSTSPLFLGKCVCVYSASDNNGAGYTEREDYLYLAVSSEVN